MFQNNYGLDLEREEREQSKEDWVFGAFSPKCIAEIPVDEREDNLPKGEIQFGLEDFQDCVQRFINNILETKLNWLLKNGKINNDNEKWLNDNGYITKNKIEIADAFGAIKSGTTRTGNSIKAPLEATRKYGFVPKSLMPTIKTMTWEQYHNPNRITPEIESLGMESTKRFPFRYEKVYQRRFLELLKKDVFGTGGYAWPIPQNGEYPRIEYRANHAFMVFKKEYYAFDTYVDPVDGDFIKKLTSDYKFLDYGYRVIILPPMNQKTQKKSWFSKWLLAWKNGRILLTN